MISTRDLSRLPAPAVLERLTRSLAALDAVLSPDWEYRYYSFDAGWSADASMASMRNGSGDRWFALFAPAGAAIHGVAHEAPMYRPGRPREGIFTGFPDALREPFLLEPAFDTENSSFCVWRLASQRTWQVGPVKLPRGKDPDGSAGLLSILDGRPERYVDHARSYFEAALRLEDVAAVYRHAPLTPELALRLNPEADLDALAADLEEIGYPHAPTRTG